ncbi:peptidylprolyl isomerase [Synechococcus sp. PROS-U-1]|uniref:peptidylprolyl isomerase n=1 Tax=Synechococcus sp. PROS-U-1 TaxID=1400866 RepID=UPI0016455015|nr:peptidylprolyl isomerase [Synechococcus sp. PROS-U-1]QNJ01779.1 hypothetical protein SynPROSU1_00134 [Synechococcus sp. PROS-U-1]
MSDLTQPPVFLPEKVQLDLLKRMDMRRLFIRRWLEEEIADLVQVDEAWLENRLTNFLQGQLLEDVLASNSWTFSDLSLNLWLPEALKRFAKYRFGAGVEEEFLLHGWKRDQVVYSMIRFTTPELAREIWIRAEENEISFTEAATKFGEGPESSHLGVIGPIEIRHIQPVALRDYIRQLEPGRIQGPVRLGDWLILIKLERIIPNIFDQSSRDRLMDDLLQDFLDDRVGRFMEGESLDQLEYHPPS